jgi:FMN-dependent NADH-azoreductase
MAADAPDEPQRIRRTHMKLLHIDSSILSDNSVSRQLTQTVVDQWRLVHPEVLVTYRDLAAEAPGHLSTEILGAGAVDPAEHSPLQREQAALGEALLDEFLAAGVIVIGAPMYNFSVPSQLKAWLDRVLVKGCTFKYAANGPVGLATGKRAVIVSSRGGVYAPGSPAQVMDHQESYLKVALGFVGITNVGIIRAEGVNMPALRDQALTAARREIRQLLEAA